MEKVDTESNNLRAMIERDFKANIEIWLKLLGYDKITPEAFLTNVERYKETQLPASVYNYIIDHHVEPQLYVLSKAPIAFDNQPKMVGLIHKIMKTKESMQAEEEQRSWSLLLRMCYGLIGALKDLKKPLIVTGIILLLLSPGFMPVVAAAAGVIQISPVNQNLSPQVFTIDSRSTPNARWCGDSEDAILYPTPKSSWVATVDEMRSILYSHMSPEQRDMVSFDMLCDSYSFDDIRKMGLGHLIPNPHRYILGDGDVVHAFEKKVDTLDVSEFNIFRLNDIRIFPDTSGIFLQFPGDKQVFVQTLGLSLNDFCSTNTPPSYFVSGTGETETRFHGQQVDCSFLIHEVQFNSQGRLDLQEYAQFLSPEFIDIQYDTNVNITYIRHNKSNAGVDVLGTKTLARKHFIFDPPKTGHIGGDNNDVISKNTESTPRLLCGGYGDDELYGYRSYSTVLLDGGPGKNKMFGSEGVEHYRITPGSHTTIKNFGAVKDQNLNTVSFLEFDKIDLTRFGSNLPKIRITGSDRQTELTIGEDTRVVFDISVLAFQAEASQYLIVDSNATIEFILSGKPIIIHFDSTGRLDFSETPHIKSMEDIDIQYDQLLSKTQIIDKSNGCIYNLGGSRKLFRSNFIFDKPVIQSISGRWFSEMRLGYDGGDNNDVIYFEKGRSRHNNIKGGYGDDHLHSRKDTSRFNDWRRAIRLDGGPGADNLYGADFQVEEFVVGDRDTIHGFEYYKKHNDGTLNDIIVLPDIKHLSELSVTLVSGDCVFTMHGSERFTVRSCDIGYFCVPQYGLRYFLNEDNGLANRFDGQLPNCPDQPNTWPIRFVSSNASVYILAPYFGSAKIFPIPVPIAISTDLSHSAVKINAQRFPDEKYTETGNVNKHLANLQYIACDNQYGCQSIVIEAETFMGTRAKQSVAVQHLDSHIDIYLSAFTWVVPGWQISFRFLPQALFPQACADISDCSVSFVGVSQTDEWLNFNPQTNTFTPLPSMRHLGAHMIQVSASLNDTYVTSYIAVHVKPFPKMGTTFGVAAMLGGLGILVSRNQRARRDRKENLARMKAEIKQYAEENYDPTIWPQSGLISRVLEKYFENLLNINQRIRSVRSFLNYHCGNSPYAAAATESEFNAEKNELAQIVYDCTTMYDRLCIGVSSSADLADEQAELVVDKIVNLIVDMHDGDQIKKAFSLWIEADFKPKLDHVAMLDHPAMTN